MYVCVFNIRKHYASINICVYDFNYDKLYDVFISTQWFMYILLTMWYTKMKCDKNKQLEHLYTSTKAMIKNNICH